MEKILYRLILGSKSPRRFELLSHLSIPFDVRTNDIDEVTDKIKPSEVVMELSLEKIKNTIIDDNEIIIGSDTLVFLGHEAIGKPKDKEEARSILLRLSGKSHDVLTGVAIKSNKKTRTFFDKTSVTFNIIDEDLLNQYIESEESLDKAGAYGIQGMALSFIKNIEGSYSNVVGFPLDLFHKELTQFMHEIDSSEHKLKSYFK